LEVRVGSLQGCMQKLMGYRMHVFTDLRPYMCTYLPCDEGLNAFPTRKMWAKHEFGNHRNSKHWVCYQCRLQFESPSEWENHVKDVHGIVFSITQRASAISMAEASKAQAMEIQKCPLCLKQGMKTQREFTTHVGKHMEAIALAALPRDADTDSEGGSTTSNDADFELERNVELPSTASEIEVGKNDLSEQDGILDDETDLW
jgi:hypothetical protein